MSMTSAALAKTHAVSPAFSTLSSRPMNNCGKVLGGGVSRGRVKRFRGVNCRRPIVTSRFPNTPGGMSVRETSWSNSHMTSADHGKYALPPVVIQALRCSVCSDPIDLVGRTMRCESGHSFDVARQGYVNLLHARIPAGTADTADMVAARVEFLAAGLYAPLAEDLARAAAAVTEDGLLVDAGA